jgi:pimeloyl-ACP methyl ester carboxylesterase
MLIREETMCSCPRYLLSLSFAAVTWAGAAAAAEPATKEVEANDISMSYVEDGKGDPVVFVHGAVSDARAWEPIRAEISDEHRFIAPTLRYFGTRGWADNGERFSVSTHADDVAAFVKALNIEPVRLVGWSYGANVAMVAALENPGMVQRLILFEPAFSSLIKEGEEGNAAREAEEKMYGPATAAVQEGDAEKATKLLIEGVFQMTPGGFDRQPEELRAMQLDNARTMPLLWSAPDWKVTCGMLKAFDKPTLLVYGAESNAYWPHVVQGMDECLPQAEVAVLPGVNHDGPIRNPAGLAKIIEDFLANP